MTDKTDSKERDVAEQWLRDRYGAYRGHFAWRELEEAFKAGRASLATNADGCQHESDGCTYTSIPPKNRCKKCGAVYTLGGPQAASAGSEPVARVNDDGFIVEIGDLLLAPGQKLYLHPSTPEGMVAEQALRKVLSVVQRYLPPDGPTAHDAMTEITEIVDPWPLGPLEKP